MPSKKSAKKKTAANKAAPKAVKKSAKKPVKKAARKTAKKSTSGKTKKTTAKKAAASTRKTAGKSAKKTKASDIIKRQAHTPAIFKTSSKRLTHIHFTMDEVREVLKKRLEEEKEESKSRKQGGNAKEAGKASNHDGAKLEEVDPPKKSKHHAASLDDILGLTGGGTASANRSGPGNVPRKFQKYHKLLIELRDEVRTELNLHSNDTLKRSQKEDAGDIAISVDAGTDNFDRDFALSLLSSEQEALNEIEEAIQRIYNGTYGICEVTGERIKAERLEAVPFTRFSVEGQKEYEMNARKRVSRAGAFLNEASGEKITFGDDDAES